MSQIRDGFFVVFELVLTFSTFEVATLCLMKQKKTTLVE